MVLEKSFERERTVKGDHGLGRGDVDPDKATFVSGGMKGRFIVMKVIYILRRDFMQGSIAMWSS